MKRQGLMHTIEAVLAAVLFLFFIATMMPETGPSDDKELDVDRRMMKTLEVIDLNKSLREPLMDRDLQTVKNRIADEVDTRSIEISGLFLNTTTGHETFSSSISDQFQVDSDLAEKVSLRVWLEDADSPNITVGGNEVESFSGTVTGFHSYDILNYTGDGSNTFEINVSGSSEAGYAIGVYERNNTGTPPENTDVLTTSYLIGGNRTLYSPVEVSVLSWQ